MNSVTGAIEGTLSKLGYSSGMHLNSIGDPSLLFKLDATHHRLYYGTQTKAKGVIHLQSNTLVDCVPALSEVDPLSIKPGSVAKSGIPKHTLRLSDAEGVGRVFYLVCGSDQERGEWQRAIAKVVEGLQPTTDGVSETVGDTQTEGDTAPSTHTVDSPSGAPSVPPDSASLGGASSSQGGDGGGDGGGEAEVAIPPPPPIEYMEEANPAPDRLPSLPPQPAVACDREETGDMEAQRFLVDCRRGEDAAVAALTALLPDGVFGLCVTHRHSDPSVYCHTHGIVPYDMVIGVDGLTVDAEFTQEDLYDIMRISLKGHSCSVLQVYSFVTCETREVTIHRDPTQESVELGCVLLKLPRPDQRVGPASAYSKSLPPLPDSILIPTATELPEFGDVPSSQLKGGQGYAKVQAKERMVQARLAALLPKGMCGILVTHITSKQGEATRCGIGPYDLILQVGDMRIVPGVMPWDIAEKKKQEIYRTNMCDYVLFNYRTRLVRTLTLVSNHPSAQLGVQGVFVPRERQRYGGDNAYSSKLVRIPSNPGPPSGPLPPFATCSTLDTEDFPQETQNQVRRIEDAAVDAITRTRPACVCGLLITHVDDVEPGLSIQLGLQPYDVIVSIEGMRLVPSVPLSTVIPLLLQHALDTYGCVHMRVYSMVTGVVRKASATGRDPDLGVRSVYIPRGSDHRDECFMKKG
ncbi:hypothetical protein KIPB_000730 [Kipferlia bialata]|uniref:PH domain-containing protein n=1 Tax=Kipferlia bialata TaxID=797122 RepID=A0A9K3GEX2_9EUKA|nr:hypothetical protein KIPB_000730 [Kipferlia bialata]|eukprot:g730.t1